VQQSIRLGIFVNSTEEFTDASLVANGVSELIKQVFGEEKGAHARAAVNTAQLPLGAAVEVEAQFVIE